MTDPTTPELEAVRERVRVALDKFQVTLTEVMGEIPEIEAVGVVIRLPGQTLIKTTNAPAIARALAPFVADHAGGYLIALVEGIEVHGGKGPKDTTPPPVH